MYIVYTLVLYLMPPGIQDIMEHNYIQTKVALHLLNSLFCYDMYAYSKQKQLFSVCCGLPTSMRILFLGFLMHFGYTRNSAA